MTPDDSEQLLARLRFQHLRLLVQIAHTGSLRGAAQVLHLTQPALSKGLKEVERVLGLRLFERTPRGLRPTDHGHVVIRGASLLIAELQHVHQEVRAAGGRAAAVLRIGAPPYVAMAFFPAVFRDLLQHDPPVLGRVFEGQVPDLQNALIRGELDALLTTYITETGALRGVPALAYEKVAVVGIAIIAPAKHPLTAASRVRWSDLPGVPWILPAFPSLIRRTIDDAFLRAGVAPPEPRIESTNPLTNIRFVASGLGLGAVPAPAAVLAERAREIAHVKIAPRVPSVPIVLIYRTASSRHPRIALLREALKV